MFGCASGWSLHGYVLSWDAYDALEGARSGARRSRSLFGRGCPMVGGVFDGYLEYAGGVQQLFLDLFRSWGIEVQAPAVFPRWRGVADPGLVLEWLERVAVRCGLVCRRVGPAGVGRW